MSRVFTTGLGDLGSIPGQLIPKIKKIVLDVSLLNTLHYKVVVKWTNLGKGITPFPTPRGSNY